MNAPNLDNAWVIVKYTDDGKRRVFVARPGSANSYTPRLDHARLFSSYIMAQLDSCPGNEFVVRYRNCV